MEAQATAAVRRNIDMGQVVSESPADSKPNLPQKTTIAGESPRQRSFVSSSEGAQPAMRWTNCALPVWRSLDPKAPRMPALRNEPPLSVRFAGGPRPSDAPEHGFQPWFEAFARCLNEPTLRVWKPQFRNPPRQHRCGWLGTCSISAPHAVLKTQTALQSPPGGASTSCDVTWAPCRHSAKIPWLGSNRRYEDAGFHEDSRFPRRAKARALPNAP